jgi:hypothetical protein
VSGLTTSSDPQAVNLAQ